MIGQRACRGAAAALALVAPWVTPIAMAQTGPMGPTIWLATATVGHDVVANCLVQAMNAEFSSSPVVSPPPRRTAYVNLWPRANPPRDPVATFHVQPERDGTLRIGWQRLANAPAGARWDVSAKAAADRCAAPAR